MPEKTEALQNDALVLLEKPIIELSDVPSHSASVGASYVGQKRPQHLRISPSYCREVVGEQLRCGEPSYIRCAFLIKLSKTVILTSKTHVP